MYNLSTEFNSFYRTEVVLPANDQNELRKKRKLNIKRLKEGLKEYNQEKGTDYRLSEDRVQGSMAMHTVVQNDEHDYDIDVAIVFEKSNLGGMGPLAVRRMVADALKRKTKQFAEDPEVKTSCVRLKYATGYHVDFAVYRRYKENETDTEYQYEHAGAEWSKRGIRAVEDWFKDEISKKGDDLRKITRLSKMFCKSRSEWDEMPGGLIQTVLCSEQLTTSNRLDELFYQTMRQVVARLSNNVDVCVPVDNNRALVTRTIDRTRMSNWRDRLSEKLDKLSILFSQDCTNAEAIAAWASFFNHQYWTERTVAINESYCIEKSTKFINTEEYIEERFVVDEQYDVEIICEVMGDGFRLMPIGVFFEKYGNMLGHFVPHHFKVKCRVGTTSAPCYDKVLWKVRNVGVSAEERNQIRGQIEDRGSQIEENTLFGGPHYIECYLIKDGICIAIGHVDVPIGQS